MEYTKYVKNNGFLYEDEYIVLPKKKDVYSITRDKTRGIVNITIFERAKKHIESNGVYIERLNKFEYALRVSNKEEAKILFKELIEHYESEEI